MFISVEAGRGSVVKYRIFVKMILLHIIWDLDLRTAMLFHLKPVRK